MFLLYLVATIAHTTHWSQESTKCRHRVQLGPKLPDIQAAPQMGYPRKSAPNPQVIHVVDLQGEYWYTYSSKGRSIFQSWCAIASHRKYYSPGDMTWNNQGCRASLLTHIFFLTLFGHAGSHISKNMSWLHIQSRIFAQAAIQTWPQYMAKHIGDRSWCQYVSSKLKWAVAQWESELLVGEPQRVSVHTKCRSFCSWSSHPVFTQSYGFENVSMFPSSTHPSNFHQSYIYSIRMTRIFASLTAR